MVWAALSRREDPGSPAEGLPLRHRLRLWRAVLVTWLVGHAAVKLVEWYNPAIQRDVKTHLLLALLPGSLLAPSAAWWYRRRWRRLPADSRGRRRPGR